MHRVIFIEVNVSTEDEGQAAKAIDVLSRMMLGLALEGIDGTLEVSTGMFDHEHEDMDHGEEL